MSEGIPRLTRIERRLVRRSNSRFWRSVWRLMQWLFFGAVVSVVMVDLVWALAVQAPSNLPQQVAQAACLTGEWAEVRGAVNGNGEPMLPPAISVGEHMIQGLQSDPFLRHPPPSALALRAELEKYPLR